jgi:hypothetical protein
VIVSSIAAMNMRNWKYRRFMHELHEWYMRSSADGKIMIAAQVKDSHLHRGLADVWIEFVSVCFYIIKTP